MANAKRLKNAFETQKSFFGDNLGCIFCKKIMVLQFINIYCKIIQGEHSYKIQTMKIQNSGTFMYLNVFSLKYIGCFNHRYYELFYLTLSCRGSNYFKGLRRLFKKRLCVMAVQNQRFCVQRKLFCQWTTNINDQEVSIQIYKSVDL